MMTESGVLFHIDFGHFLGHFKTKFGYKRERAPFVFTPQYAHILGNQGSEMYTFFENTCREVYNIVRKNAALFINLFSMVKKKKKLEGNQLIDSFFFQKDAFCWSS